MDYMRVFLFSVHLFCCSFEKLFSWAVECPELTLVASRYIKVNLLTGILPLLVVFKAIKYLNRFGFFVCSFFCIIFRHKQRINAHLPFTGQVSFFRQGDSFPEDFLSCLLFQLCNISTTPFKIHYCSIFPFSKGIKALCRWPYFLYLFKAMWCFSVYEQGEADWMRNSFMYLPALDF